MRTNLGILAELDPSAPSFANFEALTIARDRSANSARES
jgi:hypothetical protein